MNPTVRQVIEKLNFLGFDEDKIRSLLFQLYYHQGAIDSFIAFRTKDPILKSEDIQLDHIVRVTYKGKCAIGLLCNSFGYLADCAHRLKNERVVYYEKESIQRYSQDLLPHLCNIAQAHYESLQIIRDDCYKQNRFWLNNYLTDYGIPQIPPYHRSLQIGSLIGGRRRALYFETVVSSVVSFLRYSPSIKKPFEKLQNEYSVAVRTLETFTDDKNNSPNFSAIMNA
jgi:hypothetical protein